MTFSGFSMLTVTDFLEERLAHWLYHPARIALTRRWSQTASALSGECDDGHATGRCWTLQWAWSWDVLDPTTALVR